MDNLAVVTMRSARLQRSMGGRVPRVEHHHRHFPESLFIPRSARAGAVMVVVLLALILLASLLFYVMNVGRQVQSRVETQHAADAAAAAGAGASARAFNTVATHNIGMTRMLALINLMDAMPESVGYSLADQTAVVEATRGQLTRGVDGRWVREGLERFLFEVESEVAQLEPMDAMLNHSSFDMRQTTYYNPPQGRGPGELWRAMHAMDESSQALMESYSGWVQRHAAGAGRVDLVSNGDGAGRAVTSLVVPVVAGEGLSWSRGTFDNLRRPMEKGVLPTALDDPQYNRGPYDAVFGYRDLHGEWESTPRGDRDLTDSGTLGVPIGRGAVGDANDHTRIAVTGYSPFGPMTRMKRQLALHVFQAMPHSRFADYSWALGGGSSAPPNQYWVDTLSQIKLDYLWGEPARKEVVAPDWRVGFYNAIAVADTQPQKIRETGFVAVEIKSRYPSDHALFLSEGSWVYVIEEEPYYRPSPRIVWVTGWADPREWGVPQVADFVWRDEWDYGVTFDQDLGIGVVPGDNGQAISQRVYRIDDYLFVGVNLGQDVTVTHPHNFAGRGDLPAPISFAVDPDGHGLPRDEHTRREHLTFLSAVSRDNKALMGPGGFDAGRAYRRNMAVAQAQVYNDHSWDLWTPMWNSQLQRVTDFDGWVNRFERGVNTVPSGLGLDLNDAGELQRQLRHAAPLADTMLHH